MIDRLPLMKRAILAELPFRVALAWSVMAVLVPLGLRLALDGGKAEVPFITFYPAVLLAALLLGWRWGAAVTIGSAIAANRLVMHRPLDLIEPVDFFLASLFLVSCSLLVATADLARKLVRQLEAGKKREEILKHELLHRVKNMLATVSAMAAMTARHSPPDEYRAALNGRLEALQRATALLGSDVITHCDLEEVLGRSLASFRAPENMVLHGPSCRLPSNACIPLSLALHELCTNAVKYGALSVGEGWVDIRWQFDLVTRLLHLDWREFDGPPVMPPSRQGMGTQLLRRQQELGKVRIDYAPTGLVCHMEISGVTIVP